jgi:hypothetical protein
MLRSIVVYCIAGASLGLGPAFAQEAEPAGPLHSYSARFFCSGANDQNLPGNCEQCFDSEIALTNTGRETASITIWAVEARPIFSDPPPTRSEPAVELELVPNDAVRIGCGSLNRLLPAEEMLGRARKAVPNGFLRFESNKRIKAVATYVFRTVEQRGDGTGAGVSLEVVEIEPDGEE